MKGETAIYPTEEMETIARFYKAEEAYLFRSFLESEGIEAHVFDEHTPQVHWLWTIAIGGIRVVAEAEDAVQAVGLYRKYEETVNADPPVAGDVKAWPAVLLISFIVGVPLFFLGRHKGDGKMGDG